MSTSTRILIALGACLLILAIPACEPAEPPSGEDVPFEEFTRADGQDPPPDGDRVGGTGRGGPRPKLPACPDQRFIGMVDLGDVCPALEGDQPWAISKLFADPDDDQAFIPDELDRFCLYEWAGDTPQPGPEGTAALPGYKGQGFEWMNRDCWTTATQSGAGLADTSLDTVFAQHLTAFETQVERPGTLPPADGDVRVAVVDSWPREDPKPGVNPGQSLHGLAMGRIVDQLVCEPMGTPGPSCAVQIRRHLALNLEDDGKPNNILGGYYGYQGRLAATIRHAVTAWKKDAPAAKLVINLSVGWDGEYNEGSPLDAGGISDAVIAVRKAIEDAVCSGALVIAAAGNKSTGPAAATGPLYPAAWHSEPAPSCVGADAPLLYAAGGVDGRDEPLNNARPAAQPPWVAPAFAVVSELTDPTGATWRTSPLTGTSVATAVTSAAAAAVWAYDAALAPAEVMQTVYDSAEDLGAAADFCFGGACPNSRRISICRAAAAVTPGLTCVVIPAGSGSNVVWSATEIDTIAAAGVDDFDGLDLGQAITPSGCSDSVMIPSAAPKYPGKFGCPEDQLPNFTLQPFVDPQPGVDPCRACLLALQYSVSDDVVMISVDPAMSGTVYPEQLLVTDSTGATAQRWNLASAVDTSGHALGDGLTPGASYRVVLAGSGLSSSSVGAATLYWLNARTSTTSVRSSQLPVR